MNNGIYKSYKLKNISVSRFDDELMIIVNKKDRIEMKRFNIGKFKVRHVATVVSSLLLISFLVIFFAFSLPAESEAGFEDLSDLGDEIVITRASGADATEESPVEVDYSATALVTEADLELKNEILSSSGMKYEEEKLDEPLQIRIYRVQPGDTLSEIAQKFGVSMDTICGSSGLVSYDLIRTGQVLRIPNRDGILHTVKAGDQLIDVANKYKIDIEKVIAQNDLMNPDFLEVGSDVFIPDAKPQNIIPGFLWPTASRYITSAYGWRRNPFGGPNQFHNGIDIGARYEWVRSSRYGQVTYAGWMGGYGNTVIVSHPGGWTTLYAHLSTISVRRGQYVRQGQVIARSGNTGLSTGPHLHYELLRNGRHVNPRSFLQ